MDPERLERRRAIGRASYASYSASVIPYFRRYASSRLRVAIIGDGLMARSILEALPDTTLATIYGHDMVELADSNSIERLIDFAEPDVVILTAAMHRLAECEKNREQAEAVNSWAPGIVAGLAPTLFLSTDYVFNDNGPHDESLPGERPRSVYGQTKLGGELAVLGHGGIVVRIAGVFGHARSHKGPQFPDVVLADDAPLKAPTDQRFTPTYAVDAAQRIARLALNLAGAEVDPWEQDYRYDSPSGIYHATNLGGTNWAEFGSEVAEIANGKRHIIPFRAKDPIRPTDSRLVSTRLPELRHFRFALIDWAKRRATERISPLRAEA